MYQHNPELHYEFDQSADAVEGDDVPRVCMCPDDCGCHYPWRMTLCGCKAHDEVVA